MQLPIRTTLVFIVIVHGNDSKVQRWGNLLTEVRVGGTAKALEAFWMTLTGCERLHGIPKASFQILWRVV